MRIKVEGYIESADFEGGIGDQELFDPEHRSGLTEAGYEHFASGPLEFLEGVRFTRE